MKKKLVVPVALFVLGVFAFIAHADMKGKLDAKAEFDKHCGSCHANGGNSMNSSKTLSKAAMEKDGVKTWKEIVATMRKPGPGMPKYLKKEISDTEAKAIAKYILATFK